MVQYIPHEPLSVQWIPLTSMLSLNLPWLSLEIEIEEEQKEWITQAVEKLKSDPTHALTQKFLENLREYPVSYYKARPIEEIPSREGLMPEEFLAFDLVTPRSLIKSINSSLQQHIPDLLPDVWSWSAEEMSKAAQIQNSNYYDPLSIVSYLIGKRLETESITGQVRADLPQQLDKLRENKESLFFDTMKILLRQTHYVTNRFEKCSGPALQKFSAAESVIKKFMDEEHGHDRLMVASLKELGCDDVNTISPFDTTVLVMELFKNAAQTSPLAFTLMVGYFEGVTIAESDPLADVLEKSTKPQAAKGYALHHKINKDGDHSNVIFELAEFLPLLTKEEVMYGMRILKLASVLGVMSDRALYELSQGKP
jgi:hypothetical protein